MNNYRILKQENDIEIVFYFIIQNMLANLHTFNP